MIRGVTVVWLVVSVGITMACTAVDQAGDDQRSSFCVHTVEFDGPGSRLSFMEANAPIIVRHLVRQHDLFAYSGSSESRLTVAIAASECESTEGLLPLVATEGIASVRSELQRYFTPDETFGDMERRRAPGVVRPSCVITAYEPGSSRLGLFVGMSVYGGVRDIAVLKTDATVWVTSTDDCGLTLAFVEAVASELGLPDIHAQICPDPTTEQCRPPFEGIRVH